jgi:hypothetical protein
MNLYPDLIGDPRIPYERRDGDHGVIDLKRPSVRVVASVGRLAIDAVIQDGDTLVRAMWRRSAEHFPFSIPFRALPFQVSPSEAIVFCLAAGITPPDEFFALLSGPAAGTADPSTALPPALPDANTATPKPEDVGAGSTTTPTKRKRRKSGESTTLICSALDTLAAHGKWNALDKEIIKLAEVSRSTYYRLTREDDHVKKAMDNYLSRRLGKGPARKDDI